MKKMMLLVSILFFVLVCSNVYSQHHFAVFGGATSNTSGESHTYFTLGADYEYSLAFTQEIVSVGLIGDVVFGDHKEYLGMVGVFVRPPVIPLKFVVGNGYAWTKVLDETVSHYVFRIGVGYELHLTNFSLGPIVNYDVIDGHGSVVYGLTVGVGF